MSAIIRRRKNHFPAKTMTRQEFFNTILIAFLDDMFGTMFPTMANDFGDNFFTKGSYPKS